MHQRHNDERKHFLLCLTLIREWAKTLNSNKNDDLKKSMYNDLMMNGMTLYQEVLVNFCASYIQSDKLLQLSKVDSEAFVKYFSQVNAQFARVLRSNVPTFHDSHIVQIKPSMDS